MTNRSDKVVPVFDRKKRLDSTGFGIVEVRITLSRKTKYVSVRKCTSKEWKTFKKSSELILRIKQYRSIIDSMALAGEDLTIDNFNVRLSALLPKKERESVPIIKYKDFLDFFSKEIKKEEQKLRSGTIRRKWVVYRSVVDFGHIKKFSDLTPRKLHYYDDWLHDGTREDISVHNYHKVMKQMCRIAFERGFIDDNPYIKCHFNSGHCKERRPLTEEELLKLREADLHGKEANVRDLFVFSAYTGLAYADSQAFDFQTMTEVHDGVTYIDGSRIKTGSNFFTPILPPAMDVLRRHNYKLPKLSNQKANDFLHVVESRLNFNKPLTTHVARHSFATLCLSHDIPIEKLARMMGHSDIATTQIYAKILKKNITDLGKGLSDDLK